MLPMIFENAKVGDEVFSVNIGWGEIAKFKDDDTNYPVIVRFKDNVMESYTIDGRVGTRSALPTLFPSHLVPQYYLDLCPRPKRKVTKEFKGILMLSAHGNIVGFVDDVNHIWRGFRAAPFTGTYEVEE